MKDLTILTHIAQYESALEVPVAEQELLDAAFTALSHAYAPYSGFNVGAALRLVDGRVITGSNQENAAYPMCLCAERVALSAAAALYPGIAVDMIAVRVKHNDKVLNQPVAPCGACRQSLSEVADRYQRPISVVMQAETGPILKISNCKDLLPLSFDGSYL
jgi:cytidine deaminase